MRAKLSTPRAAGALLNRILAQPALVQQVQELRPAALLTLIERVGLEDAGELVAMASTAQLEEIFDHDLWHAAQAGEDEAFDASRFALWLEVMLEAGPAFAARKLLSLDEELVTFALSCHVLVVDIEALALDMSSSERSDDDDQLDKQLECALHHELEEYRVIARDPRSWEAVLAVLLELNEQHFHDLQRLLGRCCDLSERYIEDHGGLYQVLSAQESLFEDIADAREQRRAERGYVAPAAAVSFLAHSCDESEAQLAAASAPDPVTRAYFRAVSSVTPDTRRQEQGELALLLAEGESPAVRRLPSARTRWLGEALLWLAQNDATLHGTRLLELAYLGNVLLSGSALHGRKLRPVEAALAAARLCELGAERLAKLQRRRQLPARAIAEHTLVKLFRLGFHVHQAGLPARHADRTPGSPLHGLTFRRR